MILFKLKVDGFTGGDDERTGGSRQTATIASLAPGAELLARGSREVPTYRRTDRHVGLAPRGTLQLYLGTLRYLVRVPTYYR